MNTETNTFSPRRLSGITLPLLATALCASCATPDSGKSTGLACEQQADRLAITHDSQPLTEFVFTDTNIFRPYFTRVRTLDGIQVTRNHPPVPGQDAVDHPTMHPGIWMAFGNISGQDFWRNKAIIRHDQFVSAPSVHGDRLTFATESTLISSNGVPLGGLFSHLTLSQVTDGYLLVWNAAFTPTTDGFAFGDQEEMGFGVRVATPLTEKNGGKVENSDGLTGAKNAWGKTAGWCDYSGVISNRLVGITVMPDLKNFRASWFHSRDYGLVVANPFGQKAFTKGEPSSVPVKQGETFKLRFAAFIHSTPTNQPPDIAAAYKSFVNKE